jgi:HEAT repeat protein
VLKFPQLIKIELMKLTKSEKAIPELVKALNNLVKAFNDKEDNSVRWIAAEALGEIGSDAAIEGLVNALNHPYSNVRWIAAEALGKIGQHPPHRPQQRPRSD